MDQHLLGPFDRSCQHMRVIGLTAGYSPLASCLRPLTMPTTKPQPIAEATIVAAIARGLWGYDGNLSRIRETALSHSRDGTLAFPNLQLSDRLAPVPLPIAFSLPILIKFQASWA
jgi:hypothetical protein